jgi:hypothetical protein
MAPKEVVGKTDPIDKYFEITKSCKCPQPYGCKGARRLKSEFALDSRSPDKLQRWCRKCMREYLRRRKERITGKPVLPRV